MTLPQANVIMNGERLRIADYCEGNIESRGPMVCRISRPDLQKEKKVVRV